MQKKSNPFDLVNILSVVLGIVMIAVFIVWGNKRMEAIETPAPGATATSSAPAVGGMPGGAPAGMTAPGGAAGGAGPMLPMGGSSSVPLSPTR